MWAAFVRQIAAFAITRRGKRLFALIGVLLLCFAAALLIDLQLYVSAALTTLLALVSAVAFIIQHVKLKRGQRDRLARKAEAARQRALAAQARLERIDSARGALSDAVSGAADKAGRVAQATVTVAKDAAGGAADLAADGVHAISQAARRTSGAAESVARKSIARLVRRWQALRGHYRPAGGEGL